MSEDENTYALFGVILLAVSACLGMLCLLLVRILSHTKHGEHILTIRMWLHVSATLEQLSFSAFSLKYHFIPTDFSIQQTCIVLRFLSSMASTMTNSWMFVISLFYFVSTIRRTKCCTSHSLVLSHCFTWTWTFFSCLMYLMFSFLLKENTHVRYIHSCWESNPETIHIFMTYGNELFPFILAFILLLCARCRLPFKRDETNIDDVVSEFGKNEEYLTNSINRYLILFGFLTIYYISLTFRIIKEDSGSDLTIMALQSGKGIIIAITTCFVSKDILSMFRRSGKHTQGIRNSYRSTYNNINGHTGTPELQMYTFIS